MFLIITTTCHESQPTPVCLVNLAAKSYQAKLYYFLNQFRSNIEIMEWAKQTYNYQYERWMPWIEDFYLRWFTKDNKASYTAKGNSNASTLLFLR